MLFEPTLAFLDESGGHDLATEKGGATKYFTVAAVITSAEEVSSLRQSVEKIRGTFFSQGEIKSNSIGGNVKRRRKIAEAFSDLDFTLYAICVDKSAVYKDSGLQYKQTFYKFIPAQLYRRLFRAFPNLTVVCDQHGSSAFMKSVEKYVDEHHKPSLFVEADFGFADSESEVLVQAADFFAGTIRRCAGDNVKEGERELLKLFSDKLIAIDDWPPMFGYHTDPPSEPTPDDDKLVRDTAIHRARLFIQEHSHESKTNPGVGLQLDCLRYLLFKFKYVSPEAYVPMQELRNQLGRGTHDDLSEHFVRSSVIAKLRDDGVIIASSSKGYKLPASMQDLHDFVDMSRGNIEPQLERVVRCRKSLLTSSKKQIDILDHPQFVHLKHLAEQWQQLDG